MKWTKITINTLSATCDIVSSIIFDNGISGVLIEDNENLSENELKQMFVDIPLNKNSDGLAKVIFYVHIVDIKQKENIIHKKIAQQKQEQSLDLSYTDNDDNAFTQCEFDIILQKIKNELEDIKEWTNLGSLDINIETLEDIDYTNYYKQFYDNIIIDDIVIKPSFKKIDFDNKNKIVINIEAGGAFGTGDHETTRLCIRAINKYIKLFNDEKIKFLDIGCGSGILGIVAKKLASCYVINIDIDENVKINIDDNYQLNDINYDEIYFGNIVCDKNLQEIETLYNQDIIVCNIISKVIISLIRDGHISKYIKSGGYLITSGILKENEEDVLKYIKQDVSLEIVDNNYEGEWVCIVMKKK